MIKLVKNSFIISNFIPKIYAVLILLLTHFCFYTHPTIVSADQDLCSIIRNVIIEPTYISEGDANTNLNVTIIMDKSLINKTNSQLMNVFVGDNIVANEKDFDLSTYTDNTPVSFVFEQPTGPGGLEAGWSDKYYKIKADILANNGNGNVFIAHCPIGKLKILKTDYTSNCKFTIYQDRGEDRCYYNKSQGCLEVGSYVNVSVEGIQKNGQPMNEMVRIVYHSPNETIVDDKNAYQPISNGEFNDSGFMPQVTGNVYIKLQAIKMFYDSPIPGCGTSVIISKDCSGNCEKELVKIEDNVNIPENTFSLCYQVEDSYRVECLSCYKKGGLWTALGCIPTHQTRLAQAIVKIGLGLSGAVATIMILASAFSLSTSAGDTKKINDAKEQLTSAIIGLVFIIFSVTILQIIGVNILAIPGFGQN